MQKTSHAKPTKENPKRGRSEPEQKEESERQHHPEQMVPFCAKCNGKMQFTGSVATKPNNIKFHRAAVML